MKALIALMFIMTVAFSCEKTSYRMEIALENNTDDTILVQLYPKSEYQHGDSYKASDLGGGYCRAKFDIEPGSFAWLFASENLDQNPYDLASKVFDSIFVSTNDINQKRIIFKPDTVIGYTENLFDINSNWKFEHRKFNEPTNFSQNPVETDTYTFTISHDKLCGVRAIN